MIKFKFIDKCRKHTQIGMKKNMTYEYRRVMKDIKLSSKCGSHTTKFNVSLRYENRDEIYEYIMNKLKSKGFKVEIEKYGCNMSHTRLSISWKI